MKTDLFDFSISKELIATRPTTPRDSSLMLVVEDRLMDRKTADFPSFLNTNDCVVFNNTKVIPARLFGKKQTSDIEILLHKEIGAGKWLCFAKPAKKLKSGDVITFADDFEAKVEQKIEAEVILKFSTENVIKYIDKYGEMPIPPYILKHKKYSPEETQNYQTIYADENKPGSVAAPTAGLHFTPAMFEKIKESGAKTAFITLHVGGGTFLPVKAENINEHKMHSEYFEISAEAAKTINECKKSGGRVIAIGTTSLRVLETVSDETGMICNTSGETDIFITPGYRFKCVDVLFTNFHLPKSTLFMLVCAFAGLERMKSAYIHAIEQKYRFYSYGDACLLEKAKD